MERSFTSDRVTAADETRIGLGGLLVSGLMAAILVAEPPPEDVVVSVNDVTITKQDVADLARRVLLRPLGDSATEQKIRRQITQEFVSRELARQTLAKSKFGVTEVAAREDSDQRVRQLKKEGRSLQQILEDRGINETAWHREIHWQLAWKRYRSHYISDENLEKYFNEHRRDFDGTELRIAHLLLKTKSTTDDNRDQVIQAAKNIHREIADGKTTFEQAVKEHSAAPSKDQAGAIGWIARYQPMTEEFTRAAFKLKLNEVSPPVETTFGIHLIRCLEIRPGTRSWQDVRSELSAVMQDYLRQWLADQARASAKIKWQQRAQELP